LPQWCELVLRSPLRQVYDVLDDHLLDRTVTRRAIGGESRGPRSISLPPIVYDASIEDGIAKSVLRPLRSGWLILGDARVRRHLHVGEW
jgi:hypothetical protein